MPQWNFKTVKINKNGSAKFTALSKTQTARVNVYTEALKTAKDSTVANPFFSNYFVREGIGIISSKMVPAGNIEYGFCQALHGEESAISAFRSRYHREHQSKIILGIITRSPDDIVSPCGNCRDIMLDDLGTNLEIVTGTADGGTAIVMTMEQYLFSEFRKTKLPKNTKSIRNLIQMCESLTNDAYSPPKVHPERKYHAVIRTNTNIFFGAHDVMCDYHPIYALRDAVRQARRAHDPFVQSVLILYQDFGSGSPHVMYKDRQHLFELNLQAELITGQENNPQVFLTTYNDKKQITNTWETSTKKWLPLPFSPRNFGSDFIQDLTQYFQNLKPFKP